MKWIPLLLLFPSLALAQFGAFEREFVVGTSNILARSGITLGGVTRTNWPTGGGSSDAVTNATGPGITVDAGILTLSTNGWQFGAALTPWTTNIDAAGFSLDNVGTLSAANINLGDGSLADMLASRLSTNFNGAWLVGSGGITNITGGGTWTLSNGAYTFVPASSGGGATNELWRTAVWRIPSGGTATRIANGDWLVIPDGQYVEARNLPVYGISTGKVMLVGLSGAQASLVWGYEDGATNFPSAVTTNGIASGAWSNLTGMAHGLIAARLYGVGASTNAGVKVGQ
jgi:hypothetical protein